MKKTLVLLLVLVMAMTSFVGCSSKPAEVEEPVAEAVEEVLKEEVKEVVEEPSVIELEKLVVYFVPSREPEEIITATEPLKGLLSDELALAGYEVGEVDIQVGTSYEAVGEALSAGTADVGLIPGGTYVLFDDGAEVILTATRAGLNKDFDDAKSWNDGLATEAIDGQVTYYRGLMIAGPSKKGQELAEKVASGEALTKEDIESANWGVRSSSSSSGYIYPTIWLQDNFGVMISELPNVVQTDSYGSSMARLASEQVDVVTIYADARRDYAGKWNEEYSREATIWEETSVVGVTPGIYNDTVSVSMSSEIMDDALIAALQDAFINIAQTDAGKEVISIYSHQGYQIAESSDYDNERKAQEIIKSMN